MTTVSTARDRRITRALRIIAVLTAIAMIATIAGLGLVWMRAHNTANPAGSPQTATTAADLDTLRRSAAPQPDITPAAKAKRTVAAMSMEERVGQLVMAPLNAGTDPSSLASTIRDRHVGSVLIIGNWNTCLARMSKATDALQSFAPANIKLLMTTDQEGGLLQH